MAPHPQTIIHSDNDMNINIHIAINMNIDIHIIIDMDIEDYLRYYQLCIRYSWYRYYIALPILPITKTLLTAYGKVLAVAEGCHEKEMTGRPCHRQKPFDHYSLNHLLAVPLLRCHALLPETLVSYSSSVSYPTFFQGMLHCRPLSLQTSLCLMWHLEGACCVIDKRGEGGG